MDLKSPFRRWFSRPLVRDIFSTTALALVGKASGFLVPFFIASLFGAGRETDAFFFAYGLILFMVAVLGDTVGEVLIPFLTEARAAGEGATVYVGRVMFFGGVLVLTLVLVFYILAMFFLSRVIPFSPSQMALFFKLLAEMCPLVLLVFWDNVLMAALNSAKKFSFPAISLVLRSAVVLLSMVLLGGRLGVHSIALGYVVGEGVRTLAMLYQVSSFEGFPLSRESFRWHPGLFKFLGVVFFRSGAAVLNQLNLTVDKAMASWLVVGSVSVLHYAARLTLVPVLFLTAGTIIPLISHWSEGLCANGLASLKKDVKRAALIMAVVGTSVSLFLIFFSWPAVKLVYGHGALKDSPALGLIRWAWVCYLVGLPFRLVSRILVKLYIVLQRTKPILIQAVLGAGLNILFNWILMHRFGVAGIALSTSLVAFLTLLYWIWAYKLAR